MTKEDIKKLLLTGKNISELMKLTDVVSIQAHGVDRPEIHLMEGAFKEVFPVHDCEECEGSPDLYKYKLSCTFGGVYYFARSASEDSDLRLAIKEFASSMETLIAKPVEELEALNESS